jgi:hypothetical protein
MSEQYVILKRGLFYAPDAQGYTGIRDLAGRYSKADAEAEARIEGVSCMPLSAAPEFTDACFGDLARKHLAGQRDKLREQVRALGAEPCA